jgi:Lsr2
MADQPDLAVMVEDLLALSLRPCLILAVVLSELPLPLFFGLSGRAAILLELRLRAPACLLMVPAGRRAEGTQPTGRLDLVGALVGHHDRNTKRPGSERRDGDLPDQLLNLERRRRQDAVQDSSQPGDLSIDLAGPRRRVHVAAMLIGAKRLALISGLSADRGPLRSFSFLLLSPPGSLLRLMLALLAALRLGPGAKDTTAPTSRHGSSPEEHYDHAQRKAPESARQQQRHSPAKQNRLGGWRGTVAAPWQLILHGANEPIAVREAGMAQKITVVLEDDLDGGPADETVRFTLDGSAYEIDLSKKHAKALRRKLEPFISHARKAGRGPRRRAGRSAASRERTDGIRAWARAHGIAVSDRGRIPASVAEQYEAAGQDA